MSSIAMFKRNACKRTPPVRVIKEKNDLPQEKSKGIKTNGSLSNPTKRFQRPSALFAPSSTFTPQNTRQETTSSHSAVSQSRSNLQVPQAFCNPRSLPRTYRNSTPKSTETPKIPRRDLSTKNLSKTRLHFSVEERRNSFATTSYMTRDLELDPAYFQQESDASRVTVAVRVRPINERELNNTAVKDVVSIRENSVFIEDCSTPFTYDHYFYYVSDQHKNFADQRFVYETMAKPLLTHVVQGYNVCLFAYGQTGSGKSFTIMGENNALQATENTGIIPRFCKDLFNEVEQIHERYTACPSS